MRGIENERKVRCHKGAVENLGASGAYFRLVPDPRLSRISVSISVEIKSLGHPPVVNGADRNQKWASLPRQRRINRNQPGA
jgi:hypothetical protein